MFALPYGPRLEQKQMSLLLSSLFVVVGCLRYTTCAVMQAGFAMLEVGSVGAKHTKNLLVKVRKQEPFRSILHSASPLTLERAGDARNVDSFFEFARWREITLSHPSSLGIWWVFPNLGREPPVSATDAQ